VLLRASGRESARLPINNLSRGGAALRCDWSLAPGDAVEVELPGAEGAVAGRVVRSGGDELAVVFTQEPAALARIDRALDRLGKVRAAA
jgi:hypothetical protein